MMDLTRWFTRRSGATESYEKDSVDEACIKHGSAVNALLQEQWEEWELHRANRLVARALREMAIRHIHMTPPRKGDPCKLCGAPH